jgi:hypothetical protein
MSVVSRLPRAAHLAAILGAALLSAAGNALAADVIVDKAQPERSRPRFFERVQAGELANAIAKRGQVVSVPAGEYHLRVPCDSMVPGSFTNITVTIDEKTTTRVRLMECGVEVNPQDPRG